MLLISLSLSALLFADSAVADLPSGLYAARHQRIGLAAHGQRLPRQGRRLSLAKRDADAYVRCDSRYTFSLCGSFDKCTHMGSVAKGTACVNDSIISDSSSSSDNSEPIAGSSSQPSSSAQPQPTTKVASTVAAGRHAGKAGAVTKVSSTTTSVPATSTGSPESTDDTDDEGDCSEEGDELGEDAGDDEDDDSEDCSSDDQDDGSVDTVATSAVATPSSVKAIVKIRTTSRQNIPSTSASAVPSKTSSSRPAQTSTSSSGSIAGGFATYYFQEGGYGACGNKNPDSALIVAVQADRFSQSLCGKSVKVTNTVNGKSVTATVADMCPGCKNSNSLDLSKAAFDAIGDEAKGVLSISWDFVN